MRRSRLATSALLAPSLVWLCIFFLVPLLMVLAVSFAKRGQPFLWEFSTEGWEKAASEVNRTIFLRTLTFSLGTTLCCLLLGFPAAWFIVKRGPRVRQILYALVLIPLIANSLVLVYAWKTLLGSQGLVGEALIHLKIGPDGAGIYNTRWASLVGMVYYYLPFMVYPIYASLEKMDWRLMEASADLGAGKAQRFWHVVLPLVWPGVATGCILVFIQSVGTFVIPDILAGSKDLFLGKRINDQFMGMSKNWPMGAALSLMCMGAISIALIFYFKLQNRSERR